MRTRVWVMLLMLIGCAKSIASSAPRDAVLAQPSYSRSADEIKGESPDSMRQLEALIEHDLYTMGLPSLQSMQYSGMSAGFVGSEDPNTIAKTPTNNVPPSPESTPTTPNDASSAPRPTAPVAAQNKNQKNRDEKKDGDNEEMNSCQKTCSLIDNICDAAERICQITDKLPKDTDAPQRCIRAKNACTRAQSQGASCPCSS